MFQQPLRSQWPKGFLTVGLRPEGAPGSADGWRGVVNAPTGFQSCLVSGG